jgi:hypothetical protein
VIGTLTPSVLDLANQFKVAFQVSFGSPVLLQSLITTQPELLSAQTTRGSNRGIL